MKRLSLPVALTALLVLLSVASIVWAQSSADFDLSWYVMAGGGRRADSPAFAMNGTIGQGIVGFSEGTGLQVHSGYWYGASLPRYRVYLPLVVRNYP